MKITVKIVSFILCLIIMFSASACGFVTGDKDTGNVPEITNPENNSDNDNKHDGNNDQNDSGGSGEDIVIPPVIDNESYTLVSADIKDYVGDIETFVYGLLIKKLSYIYDVFPGYVIMSDANVAYGLAYTDFSECYVDETTNKSYIKSGFIPMADQVEISQEEFDSGLRIYNIETTCDDVFVWSYRSESFHDHCVIYNKYLTYGVDEYGYIEYKAEDYKRGTCDESLGSLYSYDESRYVLDLDFGDYVPIKGASLSEPINFADIEKEINDAFAKQDYNSYNAEIETNIYNAKSAVEAYFLSIQGEKFFGYDVDELLSISKDLDPLECFRITPEGIKVIDIEKVPPEKPSELVKWLVGSTCVVIAVASAVVDMFYGTIPGVSAVTGGLTGFSIKLLMEVVVSNKTLKDVDWAGVAIATVSGVISGLIGTKIGGIKNKVVRFAVDSVVDGAIGAVEETAVGAINGETGVELASKFGYGFVLGTAFSAGIKAFSSVISSSIGTVSKGVKKISDKYADKLSSHKSKLVKKVGNAENVVGGDFVKTGKKIDGDSLFTKFSARKAFNKKLKLTQKVGTDESKYIFNKSMNFLANDNLYDVNMKPITKNKLATQYIDYPNYTSNKKNIIGYVKKDDLFIPLRKKNSVIYPDFPEIDSIKVKTIMNKNFSDVAIRGYRQDNACMGFCKKWAKDPKKIPEGIFNVLTKKYPDKNIKEIMSLPGFYKKLRKIIEKETDYVLHEEPDLETVKLVLKDLHNKSFGRNGISHFGGVGFEKFIKGEFGKEIVG